VVEDAQGNFRGPDTLLNAAHVKRGSKSGGPGTTECQRCEEAAVAALPGRYRCQCVDPENGPGHERNAVSDARGGVLSLCPGFASMRSGGRGRSGREWELSSGTGRLHGEGWDGINGGKRGRSDIAIAIAGSKVVVGT
jgi:hypothetical protein